MKRFVSYILLCVSFMIGVFAGFVPSIISMNASADFDSGKNFIYQISLNENSDKTLGDIESGEAIESVVDTFKERLSAANVSTYKLETEGNDTIRLSFKAQSEINTAIANYLNFDWGIQAMSYDGKVIIESEDFFDAGEAYVDYSNSYPIIVLPLNNPEDFKSRLYDVVSTAGNEDTRDGDHLAGSADGEEEETISNESYIYLVNNWDSTAYSLDKVINNSAEADTDELNAYIDRIEATSLSSVFYDYNGKEDVYEKLAYSGFLNNANGDLATANRLATIICAKFNSTPLDYKVTLLNKDYINSENNVATPFVERLISNGNRFGTYSSVVLSTLLISTLVAFVLVTLFSILNYGIGGLATVALTSSTFVLTLFLINSIGAEFNIGSVIALIGVVIISLFTSVAYHKNLNEELYKGKQLKKANQEASKLSTGLQVDISIVACLLGLVAYLIPNSIISSAGAIFIIGGLINLILNCLVMKGFMYLLTNSSYTQDKLKLLGVESKNCPDLSKEEKPTYFENFKNDASLKTKKSLKIGALVALIASVAGILTFQIVNGNIYNSNTNTVESTRVYIQFDYNENSNIKNASDIESKVLDNIYVFDETTNTASSKAISANDILNFEYTYKENYQVTNEESKDVYFVVELNKSLKQDTVVTVAVDGNTLIAQTTLEDAFNYLISNYNNCNNLTDVSIKLVSNVNTDTNNLHCLLFGLIGCALAGLYIAFRYGISRALSSFVITIGSMIVVTGIFCLIRGPFTSQITLGVLLIALLSYSIFITLFNKEKNLLKENKIDKSDIENSKSISLLANNLTNQNVIIASLISGFVLISFLFSSTFTTYFILYTLIGFAIVLLYLGLSNDLSYYLKSKFAIVGSKFKAMIEKQNNKKSKKNADKPEQGDGPEEALFIGIND